MSNQKPLIAMASSYQGKNTIALRQTYFNAIYDAGGIPVPLERTTDPAIIARYAADFDGFFFTGGVDVDPKHYGEEITGEGVEIDEDDVSSIMLDIYFKDAVDYNESAYGALLIYDNTAPWFEYKLTAADKKALKDFD